MDSDCKFYENNETHENLSEYAESEVFSELSWESSCHEIIIDENNCQSQFNTGLMVENSEIVSKLIEKVKKQPERDKNRDKKTIIKSATDYSNDVENLRRDKIRILEGCCNNRCIDLKHFGKGGQDEFVYPLTVFNICRAR